MCALSLQLDWLTLRAENTGGKNGMFKPCKIDGLSPILFNLYLAKAIKLKTPEHFLDHGYYSLTQGSVTPLQYAV